MKNLIFLMIAFLLAVNFSFAQEPDEETNYEQTTITVSDSTDIFKNQKEGDYKIITNKKHGYFIIGKSYFESYHLKLDFMDYKDNPPYFMTNANKWKPEKGVPTLMKEKETEKYYWVWDAGRPYDPNTYYEWCILVGWGNYLPQMAINDSTAVMGDIKPNKRATLITMSPGRY